MEMKGKKRKEERKGIISGGKNGGDKKVNCSR